MSNSRVEAGDDLVPGNRYLMKIWPGEKTIGNYQPKRVTFVHYINEDTNEVCPKFDMKDLRPFDRRVCVLLNHRKETIVLRVGAAEKIWIYEGNKRVTFDKLPAVATP